MAATAQIDQSLDTVRSFNRDVFNERNYDKLFDLRTDDYVQHGPMTEQELRTKESMVNMKMFHTAFSDLEATEEFAFSDGEFVCTYYTYRGTHDGELMGVPATGEEAEIAGIAIHRIEDGKIAEAWLSVDFLSLLQQVGVVPDLDEMAS